MAFSKILKIFRQESYSMKYVFPDADFGLGQPGIPAQLTRLAQIE